MGLSYRNTNVALQQVDYQLLQINVNYIYKHACSHISHIHNTQYMMASTWQGDHQRIRSSRLSCHHYACMFARGCCFVSYLHGVSTKHEVLIPW